MGELMWWQLLVILFLVSILSIHEVIASALDPVTNSLAVSWLLSWSASYSSLVPLLQ